MKTICRSLFLPLTGCLILGVMSVAPVRAAQGNSKAYKQFRDEGRKANAAGEHELAEARFKQALEEAEKFSKPDKELIDSLKDLGFLYLETGKSATAEPLFRRALQVRESIHGANQIESADIMLPLAGALRQEAKYDEAAEIYKKAQTIIEKKLGLAHPAVSQCLLGLARIQDAQGHTPDAEQLYLKALKVAETERSKVDFVPGDPATYSGKWVKTIYSPNYVLVANVLQDLGKFYEKQNRPADAEGMYQRLLKLVEREMSKDRDSLAMALNHVAATSLAQKKYPEAETVFKKLLPLIDKPEGIWPVYIAEALHRKAALEASQDRFQEADRFLERLLNLQLAANGAKSTSDTVNLIRLANYYVHEGNLAEGEGLVKLAVQIKEKAWGPEDVRITEFLYQAARFELAHKQHDQAETLLQQALALAQKPANTNAYPQAKVLGLLIDANVGQNKQEAAVGYTRQLITVIKLDENLTQPDLVPSMERLIKYCQSSKQIENAGMLYGRIIAIKEKEMGSDSIEVADAVTKLGEFYLQAKNYAQAESYMVRSMTVEEKARGAENMSLLPTLAKMVTLYAALGKDTELEGIYKKQIVIYESLFGAQHVALVKPLEEYSALLKRNKRDEEAGKLDARIKAIKAN